MIQIEQLKRCKILKGRPNFHSETLTGNELHRKIIGLPLIEAFNLLAFHSKCTRFHLLDSLGAVHPRCIGSCNFFKCINSEDIINLIKNKIIQGVDLIEK